MGLRKGKWRERRWFPPFDIVLNSLKFRLLPKNRPGGSGGWVEDFLGAYAGLSVDGSMIAEFAYRGLERKQTMKAFSTSFSASLVLTAASRRDLYGLTPMRFQTVPNLDSEAIARKTDWVGEG